MSDLEPTNGLSEVETQGLIKINWSKLKDQDFSRTVEILNVFDEPLDVPEILPTTAQNCAAVLSLDKEWTHRIWISKLPDNTLAVVQKFSDVEAPVLVVDQNQASLARVVESHQNKIKYILKQNNEIELEALQSNPNAKAIAQLIIINTIAHEFYHLRQYYQDRGYFDESGKSVSDIRASKKSEDEAFRKYSIVPAERAARSFALRYIREQKKLLSTKASSGNITIQEQCLLNNIDSYLNYELDYEREVTMFQHHEHMHSRALGVIKKSWTEALNSVDENKRQEILDKARAAGVDLEGLGLV